MPFRPATATPPGLVARNRRNALKSTGPRTPEGKRRASLNALKHGRYARGLGERLEQCRCREDAAVFGYIVRRILACFEPQTERECRQATRLAAQAWCALRLVKLETGGTKPEGALKSTACPPLLPSRNRTRRRLRIHDRRRGRALIFWTQLRGPRPRTPVTVLAPPAIPGARMDPRPLSLACLSLAPDSNGKKSFIAAMRTRKNSKESNRPAGIPSSSRLPREHLDETVPWGFSSLSAPYCPTFMVARVPLLLLE